MKIDLNRGVYQIIPKNPDQPVDPKEAAKLKEVCGQFEALFLYQIMEKARQAMPKSDLFGKSQGEDIFRGMLNQELSVKMAQAGGIGLGKMLYDQMSRALKTTDNEGKDS